jgi:hypothetical protein
VPTFRKHRAVIVNGQISINYQRLFSEYNLRASPQTPATSGCYRNPIGKVRKTSGIPMRLAFKQKRASDMNETTDSNTCVYVGRYDGTTQRYDGTVPARPHFLRSMIVTDRTQLNYCGSIQSPPIDRNYIYITKIL